MTNSLKPSKLQNFVKFHSKCIQWTFKPIQWITTRTLANWNYTGVLIYSAYKTCYAIYFANNLLFVSKIVQNEKTKCQKCHFVMQFRSIVKWSFFSSFQRWYANSFLFFSNVFEFNFVLQSLSFMIKIWPNYPIIDIFLKLLTSNSC